MAEDSRFVPESEEGEDDVQENITSHVIDEADRGQPDQQPSAVQESNPSATAVDEEFQRRYINEKWYGRYGEGDVLEFVGNEWVPVKGDDAEFILQLWLEQETAEKKTENYTWDSEQNKWVRNEDIIDEDFLAEYQANYGVQYSDVYKKMDDELQEKMKQHAKEEEEKKEKKKKRKPGEAPPQPQGWQDLSEKVHAVYVSNLPTDITDEEFVEFMSKCGYIKPDARTGKPKCKLYRDDNGDMKGDGRCCYFKKESVELALSILDGSLFKGKPAKVEEAEFQLKGDFDPAKKKKKLTPAQKKRYMEQQNKVFEWKPEKPRNYRPVSDCTVILKNLFTLEQMAKNAALLLDLKEEVQKSCEKYGIVKKVVVYDNNPDGVVSVSFTTTDESDSAVKFLNGRIVDGRKLTAELWDGKTKYKVEESEEERKKRLAAWESFIGAEAEVDDDDDKAEEPIPASAEAQ